MLRKLRRSSPVLMLLLAPALAGASTLAPPTLMLATSEGSWDLSQWLQQGEQACGQADAWCLNDWSSDQMSTTPTGFTVVDLDLFFDPDPKIVYASHIIDSGAPSTFGFTFTQGIVATTAPGSVFHTYSASSTDGGDAVYTMTPVAPTHGMLDSDGTDEVSVFTLSKDGGTTLENAGLDLGPLHSHTSPSSTHGPFTEGFVGGPGPAGTWDYMRIDVRFSLNGDDDAYTFNGRAEVVPEPSTAALLGLGLLGLAARRARRRR